MTVDQWAKILVIIPFMVVSLLFAMRDEMDEAQLSIMWAIALAVAIP